MNFLPRFLMFFLHCLQCCCVRLSTTLGFVGFEFYSVFPGQSKYVHNSSLKLLDGDLESWLTTYGCFWLNCCIFKFCSLAGTSISRYEFLFNTLYMWNVEWSFIIYSWLPITQTLKGNRKSFELSGARKK